MLVFPMGTFRQIQVVEQSNINIVGAAICRPWAVTDLPYIYERTLSIESEFS